MLLERISVLLAGLLAALLASSLVVVGRNHIPDSIRRSLKECDAEFRPQTCKLAGEVADFTSMLLSQIMKPWENTIMSPLSIHTALQLLLIGAQAESREELKSLLKDPTGGTNGMTFACLLHELHDLRFADKHIQPPNPLEMRRSVDRYPPMRRGGKRRASSTPARRGQEGDRRDKKEFMDKSASVDLLNAVFYHESLGRPSMAYKNSVNKFYNGTFESFYPDQPATVERLTGMMNSWAKQAGFGKDILEAEELTQDDVIMLISAIGLKASWASASFHERERQEAFRNIDNLEKPVSGTVVEGESDYGRHLEISKSSDDKTDTIKGPLDAYVTELGLARGQLHFTIIQPKEHSFEAYHQLRRELLDYEERRQNDKGDLKRSSYFSNCRIGELCGKKLRKLLIILEESAAIWRPISIRMPKFRLDSSFDLIPALKQLGISSVFNETRARLDGLFLVKRSLAHVSKVSHDAFIEVDKDGVKAAGVTKVTVILKSMVEHVTIDRPFIFVVRYKTLPIFVGQLVKLPRSAGSERG